MAFRARQPATFLALSLTPLIDVVFQLLIFFLLATQFSEEEQELDIQLPSVTEARPLISRPQEIFINIDNTGQYIVSGQKLDLNTLEQRLAQLALQNPMAQTVIVRADGRCPFNYIAVATDACHRVGLHDIRLHSQSK
ncbi:MAG: biopolymer transporter ExbD [Pirellulales bacterium]